MIWADIRLDEEVSLWVAGVLTPLILRTSVFLLVPDVLDHGVDLGLELVMLFVRGLKDSENVGFGGHLASRRFELN